MRLGLNDAVREQSGSIRQGLKVKKRWQPEGAGGEGACTEKEWVKKRVKNWSRTGQERVGGWWQVVCLPAFACGGVECKESAGASSRRTAVEAKRGKLAAGGKPGKARESPRTLRLMEECQKQQESVKALI